MIVRGVFGVGVGGYQEPKKVIDWALRPLSG